MILFVLSLLFLALTIPVVTLIRLVTGEKDLTLGNILIHMLLQCGLTGVMFYLTVQLSDLNPGSVAMIAVALLSEAVFRGLRRYASS